jgi:hypothetical protein
MRDGLGYWLLMTAPATLSIEGDLMPAMPALPPEYAVCTGWNLIGPRIGEASVAVQSYLEGNTYSAVYGYDNGTGAYFQVLSGDMLDPGNGYWVAFSSAGVIRK